jgi:hypothetical protein
MFLFEDGFGIGTLDAIPVPRKLIILQQCPRLDVLLAGLASDRGVEQ